MRNLLLLVALWLSSNITVSAEDYIFSGTLDEAKILAAETGKYILVDFYAQWCAPCKWMEETSFSDQHVKSILSDNYISLKINIDEFEGYEMKEHFQVRFLPTILIFNSSGDLVERVEEVLSPNKFKLFLNKPFGGKYEITRPTPKINRSPSKAARNYKKLDKSSYRIQVGAYTDFKAAFRKVKALKREFLEPVIVLNGIKDKKTIYKIMMGEFKTIEEAESFSRILLTDFNIKGVVK